MGLGSYAARAVDGRDEIIHLRPFAVLKTLNHLTTRSGILVGLRRENDSCCCYSVGCLRAWVILIFYTMPHAWVNSPYHTMPSAEVILIPSFPVRCSVSRSRMGSSELSKDSVHI